ncbi:MAG TPA: PqqD family protein [Candidatus Omnitrophota bacterium]|nr:PqqD family protein [Candidatus Omnitrophota bacterium]HNQ50586.1 PqqD family protein [Candidatus Omnitrophota bacterium]HQO38584.1 PqqD family protein [Candidatus Omnitrophota bacterium]HQQ06228.1 PqqD family protein [Candidatus Omnitrophota bacterium]
MRIDKNRCFKKNGQLICKEDGSRGVVIDPYRRTLVRLNEAARQIWDLLDGKTSCAGIISRLTEAFDADAREIEKDAEAFLTELLRREMIE